MRFSSVCFQLFKRNVERSKSGKLQKLAAYLGNILNDYKTVASETLTEMREHPVKGSVYLTAIGTLCALLKTNPTHRDYLTELFNSGNELSLLGDPIRNPYSNDHVQTLLAAHKDGRLKHMNLLFFSVIWIDHFHSSMRLYESQCKHLRVGVRNFHRHVVDVGAVNRWWWMSKVMEEYDVNPSEWGEAVARVDIKL